MWNDELERAAANGEPMPDGLDGPARTLYIAMRGLYYQYRMNIIDQQQAKQEKVLLMNDYRGAVLDEKCRAKSRELWRTLPYDVMKCECPECKRIAKLVLGLN